MVRSFTTVCERLTIMLSQATVLVLLCASHFPSLFLPRVASHVITSKKNFFLGGGGDIWEKLTPPDPRSKLEWPR